MSFISVSLSTQCTNYYLLFFLCQAQCVSTAAIIKEEPYTSAHRPHCQLFVLVGLSSTSFLLLIRKSVAVGLELPVADIILTRGSGQNRRSLTCCIYFFGLCSSATAYTEKIEKKISRTCTSKRSNIYLTFF